jgi:hypothetical protein
MLRSGYQSPMLLEILVLQRLGLVHIEKLTLQRRTETTHPDRWPRYFLRFFCSVIHNQRRVHWKRLHRQGRCATKLWKMHREGSESDDQWYCPFQPWLRVTVPDDEQDQICVARAPFPSKQIRHDSSLASLISFVVPSLPS